MLTHQTALFARAISELRSLTSLPLLKQTHAFLTTSGFSIDTCAIARILRFAALSLPGDIDYASAIFNHIRCPDVSLCNTMLQGYSLRSQHGSAVAQFTKMFQNGSTPNEHTFPVLLKSLSCSCSGNPMQIHTLVFKLGHEVDSFVQNSLLWCYAKDRNLISARKLFDEMPNRDALSWNAMIQGHVKNHLPEFGIVCFIKMRSSCVEEIDEAIIVSVLSGSAMAGNLWLGKSIQALYVEPGRVKRDVFVGSALVDMYSKCGCCFDARKVFDEMPFRNVVAWTSLISGYVHCSRFKESLSVFHSMLVNGQNPNQRTIASVLSACAQTGALEQGRWVHKYMERAGMELNSIVGAALIDMYAKCGRIDDAKSMFHRLAGKDVRSWTAMINGLAAHGLSSECLSLFSEMLRLGIQPNEVTFLSVLCACCHGGFVPEGKKLFAGMLESGIVPKIEHYGCMVDLLARAGRLEEAVRFMESIPVQPSVSMWKALFSGCMIHGDLELGEKAGRRIVGMEPERGGSGYLLLANLYAVSKRWEEASAARKEIRGRKAGLAAAGCSWLELNGHVHEFLASDGTHHRTEAIYEALDGITMAMKLQD